MLLKFIIKVVSFIVMFIFVCTVIPVGLINVFASDDILPTDISQKLSNYNVVFTTKGTATIKSRDSMPLGNGDIAANVWVEENGDLMFYIAKSDAFSEATRLLKIGKVRINITPNPFATGKPFKQELKLVEGAIYVTAGDVGNQVTIKVWIDANNPVIHVQATGDSDFSIKSSAELWRTTSMSMNSTTSRSYIGVHINTQSPPTESADVVLNRTNKVVWYHRNTTTMYQEMLNYQGMAGYETKYPDPYKNTTFGAEIIGTNMVQGVDNKTLVSNAPSKSFDLSIYAHTAKTDTTDQWEQQINDKVALVNSTPIVTAFQNHLNWWNSFWNRSWIFITGDTQATTVTRGYLLQRYMVACMGRGAFPIKFNGGLFTMPDPTTVGDDFRDWGSMYWHQNTRLVYWPMLQAGDFDLIMRYFDMYKNQLPLRKDIAKQFFKVDGAYYPEQIFAYGADGTRDKMKWALQGTGDYTTYHWQNGFEVVAMMLDYYEITKDEKIVTDYILPIGQEVVRFYYQKYMQPNGKLSISPSNALETNWNCTNPTDHVAGLRFIIPRMINLPSNLTSQSLLTEWHNCFNALPEIPINTTTQTIKRAETVIDGDRNIENPELYTVFPYRHYGLGKGNINIGINTFNNRVYKNNGCWYQDGVQAALLGLTNDAKNNVVYGFSAKDGSSKFPGFWAKGNDEVPDFDNGGQASAALQRMLLQCEGKEMRLLPSWPSNWNVDFKLLANDNTTLRVVYENGKVITKEINKPERLSDIIEKISIPTPQAQYKTLISDSASATNLTQWTTGPTLTTDNANNVYQVKAAVNATTLATVGDKV